MQRPLYLIALFTCLGTLLQAAPPDRFTYQGRLLDAGGEPVNGTVDITATVYPAALGGAALWGQTNTGVAVADGLYSIELGGAGFPPVLTNDAVWLDLTVNGELLVPRQPLTSVPYAMRAAAADAAAVQNLTGLPWPGYDDATATNPVTLHVSPAGSDLTGDGSVGNPFATIQHAVDQTPRRLFRRDYLIQLADGVYLEAVRIEGMQTLGGSLVLIGNTNDVSAVSVGSIYVGDVRGAGLAETRYYPFSVSIRDLTLTDARTWRGTSTQSPLMIQAADVSIDRIRFALGGADTAVLVTGGGRLYAGFGLVFDCDVGFGVDGFSELLSTRSDWSGTVNALFVGNQGGRIWAESDHPALTVATEVFGTTSSRYSAPQGYDGDVILPVGDLEVGANVRLTGGDRVWAFSRWGGAGRSHLNITATNEASRLYLMRDTPDSYVSVGESGDGSAEFRVFGALVKSSGTFDIPHPDPAMPEGARLRHSFVESPTAGDNLYRYEVEVVEGRAVIDLPAYFRHLNTRPQAWVSPVDVLGVARAEVDLSSVRIEATADGRYNVLVIATRNDPAAVDAWGTDGPEYIAPETPETGIAGMTPSRKPSRP